MERASSVVPDSCIDLVKLVPCGHSFGTATVDVLISRGEPCPLDKIPIASYETSSEAGEHLAKARKFYDAFNYPEAINTCIKAMALNPNYPKAQTLFECCLLAQAKKSVVLDPPSGDVTQEFSAVDSLARKREHLASITESIAESAAMTEETVCAARGLRNEISALTNETIELRLAASQLKGTLANKLATLKK